MKITILGSGAWAGIPAPFCACIICQSAVKDPSSKNSRTRPQLLIEGKSGKFFLEASPDIRLQAAKANITEMTDFVVSHWHFDHMYGLHELLSWSRNLPQKPIIHCSTGTAEILEKEFSYLPLTINKLAPFKPFVLYGVTVTPLPVYHMRPQDKDIPESSLQNTYAYLLESDDVRIAYLADYYLIPEMSLEKIKNADIVIADGTYLFTDGYKETRLNHLHGDDILSFTKSLPTKKVYYHSISHLTKKSHEELQRMMPASHFVSYDGMQIVP